MKKFLLSLATVLCAGAFANAAEVSVDIAANNFNVVTADTEANYTANGFTFTLKKNESTTNNRLSDTNHLRLYQKATFTVAGDNGQQITKIVLSCVSGKSNKGLSVGETTYTWSSNTLTWDGDATEVIFYNPSSVVQINKATITYAAEGEVVVAEPEFSVPGGKYSEAQTVTLTAGDGCTIYYTTDGVDPTDDVNDGSSIKYTEPITVDKSMTIKAIAFDADDNKSNVVTETYDIVTLLEGAEGDGTEANPYNAAAAYNEALLGSTATVYVKGIISSVSEVETVQYGNASYYISADGTATNQFYIFRGYYLNGEKFTAEDQIKAGDTVVVKGALTTYKDVPQLGQGNQIAEINGETPEPIVLEGEGTEADPYTVADIIKINPTDANNSPEGYTDKVWVKGYIVGYMPSKPSTNLANTVFGTGNDTAGNAPLASNIVLAPTAACTTPDECIGIQLPSGKVRTALNLKDNADKLGAEVAVYGNIMKYSGSAGIKNTTDYKLVTTGVEGIEIEENNAPVEYFNLQGVRVDNPANGLYIMRQGDKVTKVIK